MDEKKPQKVVRKWFCLAGVDPELLEGVFEGSKRGTGLLVFHSAFLQHIAKPPGVNLDKVTFSEKH